MNDWGEIKTDWNDKAKNDIKKENVKRDHHYAVISYQHSTKHLYRRAYSELTLLDLMDDCEFSNNDCYHFITAGNIDSLSFLKIILRKQNLDYCLFSTWCMAPEDILQFDEWLKQGKIKKLDAFVGEIFPNTYKKEFEFLKEVFKNNNCGRIAVFKNHSKIYAGYGEKFYFGIESSANINTNPRTENACITINKGIFDFYKEYFDNIKSFE
jgi:hypothetical protein